MNMNVREIEELIKDPGSLDDLTKRANEKPHPPPPLSVAERGSRKLASALAFPSPQWRGELKG